MAFPIMTPSIPFDFLFFIFKTSSKEETPPEIMKGIFVKFDKDKVSSILGPALVPSLSISV